MSTAMIAIYFTVAIIHIKLSGTLYFIQTMIFRAWYRISSLRFWFKLTNKILVKIDELLILNILWAICFQLWVFYFIFKVSQFINSYVSFVLLEPLYNYESLFPCSLLPSHSLNKSHSYWGITLNGF
jgi:hypothetical protein